AGHGGSGSGTGLRPRDPGRRGAADARMAGGDSGQALEQGGLAGLERHRTGPLPHGRAGQGVRSRRSGAHFAQERVLSAVGGTESSGERVRAAAIARARSGSRPTHRMTLLGARVSDVWEAIEVHETRAVELGPSVLAKGCDSGSQCGRSRPAQMQLLWEVPE